MTGTLFAPVLSEMIGEFNNRFAAQLHVLPVENDYFGGDVSVAGLLTGGDFAAMRAQVRGDFAVIPRVALKSDEAIFLDGMRLEDLQGQFDVPVYDLDFASMGKACESGVVRAYSPKSSRLWKLMSGLRRPAQQKEAGPPQRNSRCRLVGKDRGRSGRFNPKTHADESDWARCTIRLQIKSLTKFLSPRDEHVLSDGPVYELHRIRSRGEHHDVTHYSNPDWPTDPTHAIIHSTLSLLHR